MEVSFVRLLPTFLFIHENGTLLFLFCIDLIGNFFLYTNCIFHDLYACDFFAWVRHLCRFPIFSTVLSSLYDFLPFLGKPQPGLHSSYIYDFSYFSYVPFFIYNRTDTEWEYVCVGCFFLSSFARLCVYRMSVLAIIVNFVDSCTRTRVSSSWERLLMLLNNKITKSNEEKQVWGVEKGSVWWYCQWW